MIRDIVLLSFLMVAFATLLTAHVALTIGLARHGPRARAVAAFFVPPLAPYWGWRDGMRRRGVLWGVAAISYVVALCFAMR
jgi:hypothetical protein